MCQVLCNAVFMCVSVLCPTCAGHQDVKTLRCCAWKKALAQKFNPWHSRTGFDSMWNGESGDGNCGFGNFHYVKLKYPLFLCPSLSRVINAGKSTLNEDQACCEVLVVKRRPAGSSTPNRTPTTRRRSSLPNGEGLGLRECLVSPTDNGFGILEEISATCNCYDNRKWWVKIS